jgi:hypothetical protein
MRCGVWAKDLCPEALNKTRPIRMSRGQKSRLLRDGVGIHLAARARTDGLARWRHQRAAWRGTRNRTTGGHRSRRIAARRDAEHALSGARPPRLTPILHETWRPGAHVRCDIGFRERIVSIERPRIGVARTGKNRGQPSIRRTSARRNHERGRQCGDKTYSVTVDHFTILRNGRQVPGRIPPPQSVFVRPPHVPAMILPAL